MQPIHHVKLCGNPVQPRLTIRQVGPNSHSNLNLLADHKLHFLCNMFSRTVTWSTSLFWAMFCWCKPFSSDRPLFQKNFLIMVGLRKQQHKHHKQHLLHTHMFISRNSLHWLFLYWSFVVGDSWYSDTLTLLSCLFRSSSSELRIVLSCSRSELSVSTLPLSLRSSSALSSESFSFTRRDRISSYKSHR